MLGPGFESPRLHSSLLFVLLAAARISGPHVFSGSLAWTPGHARVTDLLYRWGRM